MFNKKVTCHILIKNILNNNDFCKYKIFESLNEDIFSYGAFNEYYHLRKAWSMPPFIREATSLPFQMPFVRCLPGFCLSQLQLFQNSDDQIYCLLPIFSHQVSCFLQVYWEFRILDFRANDSNKQLIYPHKSITLTNWEPMVKFPAYFTTSAILLKIISYLSKILQLLQMFKIYLFNSRWIGTARWFGSEWYGL